MLCHRCKRDLDISEFSPSRKALNYPICKNCENKKAENYRITRILEEEQEKNFNEFFGGIKINITNKPREFQIIQTSGKSFYTKDKQEFINYLLGII